MNYGLYLSAAGALANMHRQDVLANNLANMNTVGFKPDAVDTRERMPERLESPACFSDPKWMLEQLGGGLFVEPTRVDLAPGSLVHSGNDLDVALEGDGLLVVDDGRGATAGQQRLTRDGRFTLNERGELVMSAGGYRVLSAEGRPIRLDPGLGVRIDEGGAISQGGRLVARLDVVAAPSDGGLQKVGANLLRPADGVRLSARPTSARVRQGYVESSAVDPILTLNAMISATKAAQSSLKMMQYHDQLLGQTFNTFGRVA